MPRRIGFRRFKIVDQRSFRELANRRCLYDRVTGRLMRYMGCREPQYIRRAGRFFVTGHSSGPVPWHGDGSWRSADATRSGLREAIALTHSTWYDIHAMAD